MQALGRKSMVFTESFTFEPLSPFSLDLSAQIFSSGDRQVRSYANGVFSQVLRIDETLVLIKLLQQAPLSIQK